MAFAHPRLVRGVIDTVTGSHPGSILTAVVLAMAVPLFVKKIGSCEYVNTFAISRGRVHTLNAETVQGALVKGGGSTLYWTLAPA